MADTGNVLLFLLAAWNVDMMAGIEQPSWSVRCYAKVGKLQKQKMTLQNHCTSLLLGVFYLREKYILV